MTQTEARSSPVRSVEILFPFIVDYIQIAYTYNELYTRRDGAYYLYTRREAKWEERFT